jgi:hypothetical protein
VTAWFYLVQSFLSTVDLIYLLPHRNCLWFDWLCTYGLALKWRPETLRPLNNAGNSGKKTYEGHSLARLGRWALIGRVELAKLLHGLVRTIFWPPANSNIFVIIRKINRSFSDNKLVM